MSIVSESAPNLLRMPGATYATRLKVYDTPGPDGQIGGAPHMHLLCSEVYFVTAGSGVVEMVDAGGYAKMDLPLHSALIFGPGTIHRVLNPNHDLELLIVMQNNGLFQHGDHILTFSTDVMNDDDAFKQATQATTFEQVSQRRDQAVQGFLELKAAFDQSPAQGRMALEQFYKNAAARTTSHRAEWREIISNGALAEVQETLLHADRLAQGNVNYLLRTQQYFIEAGGDSSAGFSGQLKGYLDSSALLPEGKTQ